MKLVLKIFIFQITCCSQNSLRAEAQCLICGTELLHTNLLALGNTNAWLKLTRAAQNISYCVQEKILSSVFLPCNELLLPAPHYPQHRGTATEADIAQPGYVCKRSRNFSAWPLLGIYLLFVWAKTTTTTTTRFPTLQVLTLNYGLFSRSFVRI